MIKTSDASRVTINGVRVGTVVDALLETARGQLPAEDLGAAESHLVAKWTKTARRWSDSGVTPTCQRTLLGQAVMRDAARGFYRE